MQKTGEKLRIRTQYEGFSSFGPNRWDGVITVGFQQDINKISAEIEHATWHLFNHHFNVLISMIISCFGTGLGLLRCLPIDIFIQLQPLCRLQLYDKSSKGWYGGSNYIPIDCCRFCSHDLDPSWQSVNSLAHQLLQ